MSRILTSYSNEEESDCRIGQSCVVVLKPQPDLDSGSPISAIPPMVLPRDCCKLCLETLQYLRYTTFQLDRLARFVNKKQNVDVIRFCAVSVVRSRMQIIRSFESKHIEFLRRIEELELALEMAPDHMALYDAQQRIASLESSLANASMAHRLLKNDLFLLQNQMSVRNWKDNEISDLEFARRKEYTVFEVSNKTIERASVLVGILILIICVYIASM